MEECFIKLVFPLKKDSDGYPPVAYESLWAKELGNGIYQIDNIPYYIYGISKGDIVRAEYANGEVVVSSIEKRGGHSTIRVFASNNETKISVSEKLKQIGAFVSLSSHLSLFSVDIPENIDFNLVDSYLSSISDDETVAYEDACLQHQGIDENRIHECSNLLNIVFNS